MHFNLLHLVQPYISHSSMSHVQNLMKSQMYTYLSSQAMHAIRGKTTTQVY